MLRKDVDRSVISPMMKQYLDIKDEYEDAILFYRVGDFYEMFFDDASVASKTLELTLTGKSCGLDERVPMCGVPFHAYLPYLEKLVNKGYKVAICEQLTDPKESQGMVDRGVIEVVTKGTIMENNALNEKDNNYISSIYDFTHCYVICYADITTGEISALLIPHDQSKLINEILRINIKEIIVNSIIDRNIINNLRNYGIVTSIYDELELGKEYAYIYQDINDIRIITSVKHLLSYLIKSKMPHLSHLRKVKVIDKKQILEIDLYSKRNLELVETLRLKERTYSLLWLLDKTKTAMGSRLLKHYIENPSIDKDTLERRYDNISKLLTEFILREELILVLDKVYDLERLAGRISYGNINARDLIQLKNSLQALPDIKRVLTDLNYDKNIETLDDLTNLLASSIKEDAKLTIKDGDIIKEGFNSDLDELRSLSTKGKDFILDIEEKEKRRTGIKNLKVGFNKVFGYYIEITKGQIKELKEEWGYIRKQTLVNAERFIIPELKEKEDQILNAEEKSYALEYKLFTDIKEEAKTYISRIQTISSIIAEIDVLTSLSRCAEDYNLVRPTISDNKTLIIKEGRHPVVEKVLKTNYVANDVIMDEKTNILLITGPNMSGKSTYMRMVAIIAIMTQIGSFVPCKEAKMPIFDKIFTRIGASDDLVAGESTFMVEMKEANNAVSNSTKNSLILFDELGRGTATYDGIALAESILEYIHNNIQAKTLFSTHYHELTNLDKNLRYLKNIHVSAKEENGSITFLHKIEKGPVDKSYGIHVASLVNLPKEIIKRAEEILNVYENQKTKKEIYEQTSLPLDFNTTKENKTITKIKEINPLEITPLEALNFLYEIKKEVEDEDGKK